MYTRIFLNILFLLLFSSHAIAGGADDFYNKQNFSYNPPDLSSELESLIASAGYGDYISAAPFAAPVPAGIPAGASYIEIKSDYGMITSVIGSVACYTSWSRVSIYIKFIDGTTFHHIYKKSYTVCSNGLLHVTEEWKFYSMNPSENIYNSHTMERDNTIKKSRRRVKALVGAATLEFPGPSPDAALADGTLDSLEITAPPGVALDLRGHTGTIGAAHDMILLRCDTILMDPGVTLTDLFTLPPTTLPGAIDTTISADLPSAFYYQNTPAIAVSFNVYNEGSLPQSLVSVGIAESGPTLFPFAIFPSTPIAPGSFAQVTIHAAPPFGMPQGTATDWNILAQTGNGGSVNSPVRVVHDLATVIRWGTGTAGCTGPHILDLNQTPKVGSQTLQFTCTNAPDNPLGLLMFAEQLDLAGNQVLGYGAQLYLNLFDPEFTYLTIQQSGPGGNVAMPVQVPANPMLAGRSFGSQVLWIDVTPCSAEPFKVSTSGGVGFSVLP